MGTLRRTDLRSSDLDYGGETQHLLPWHHFPTKWHTWTRETAYQRYDRLKPSNKALSKRDHCTDASTVALPPKSHNDEHTPRVIDLSQQRLPIDGDVFGALMDGIPVHYWAEGAEHDT